MGEGHNQKTFDALLFDRLNELKGSKYFIIEAESKRIGRGCAKVNISTALKIAFMQAGYDHMASKPGTFDPPAQMQAQHAAVKAMASDHIRMFGSEGKAW